MTAIVTDWRGVEEHQHDVFNGDMMFWRFHQSWLASIGMVEMTPGDSALHAPLSALGRSVLLMLQATREPEFERLPMTAVMAAATADCTLDGEAREHTLKAFEREVGFRRHVFARESIGTSHLVTLTGITAGARMPTRNVAWSQSFPNAHSRDDLFAWLAERVHRWDDWGKLAHHQGATALTSHLLSVIVGAGGLSR